MLDGHLPKTIGEILTILDFIKQSPEGMLALGDVSSASRTSTHSRRRPVSSNRCDWSLDPAPGLPSNTITITNPRSLWRHAARPSRRAPRRLQQTQARTWTRTRRESFHPRVRRSRRQRTAGLKHRIAFLPAHSPARVTDSRVPLRGGPSEQPNEGGDGDRVLHRPKASRPDPQGGAPAALAASLAGGPQIGGGAGAAAAAAAAFNPQMHAAMQMIQALQSDPNAASAMFAQMQQMMAPGVAAQHGVTPQQLAHAQGVLLHQMLVAGGGAEAANPILAMAAAAAAQQQQQHQQQQHAGAPGAPRDGADIKVKPPTKMKATRARPAKGAAAARKGGKKAAGGKTSGGDGSGGDGSGGDGSGGDGGGSNSGGSGGTGGSGGSGSSRAGKSRAAKNKGGGGG